VNRKSRLTHLNKRHIVSFDLWQLRANSAASLVLVVVRVHSLAQGGR
jgi:hypothetical protein